MAYAGPIAFPVNEGGTGDTSFTAYSVITGGTTSTGALQNVSGVGTAGQVLTSNGASALPTWQVVGSGGSGDAKAWGVLSVNGGGTVTLVNSFNVTSASSTLPSTITLTSGLSNSNYAVLVTTDNPLQPGTVSSISSSTQFAINAGSGSINVKLYFSVFGD